MTRRDDLREIDRALHRITRIGRGRTAAALRASRSGVDLTRTGVAVLAALVQRGALRPTALAEHADAEPAIVTREMRVLTAQGFVRSEPDPSDGRARLIEITDRRSRRRSAAIATPSTRSSRRRSRSGPRPSSQTFVRRSSESQRTSRAPRRPRRSLESRPVGKTSNGGDHGTTAGSSRDHHRRR